MGVIVGKGDIGEDLRAELVKLLGEEGVQSSLDCVCSLLENLSEPLSDLLFVDGEIDSDALGDLLRAFGLMIYVSGYIHGKSEAVSESGSDGVVVGDICPIGRLSGSC